MTATRSRTATGTATATVTGTTPRRAARHPAGRTHRTAAGAAAALLLACAGAMPALAAPAQVWRAADGQALAVAAPGGEAEAVGRALRARGADAAATATLVEQGRRTLLGGQTQVRLAQQVGGLTVHGSEVRATFDARGGLRHLVERVAAVPGAAPKVATVDAAAALRSAMNHLHPDARVALVAGPARGAAQRFAGTGFLHRDAEVTRVLIPQADGSLAEGFVVETWTQRGNQLHHTLVSGDGRIVSVENRTANDSYNIFPVDPGKGPQQVVAGPVSNINAPSPSGWLGTGTQTSFAINGNNVSAYLDTDANNRADAGGNTVTGGNFLAAASLTQSPSTTGNKAVAVQNLFYLNNVIHDILYRHGFNEAAGNFQTNNFGKGGAGNDPVNAEAQDGSGTDNANFSTPTDGSRPRMQMYLWTGAGATHEVVVGGTVYAAMGASFGPALTTTGLSAVLVAGNDGVGTGSDGCEALPATVRNRIVLLDRGTCNFTVKVQNAQAARAAGVIIANNTAGAIFTMSGTANLRIPAVMVSQADGAALRALASPTATMRRKAVLPLQIDASLDSDVVFHEYGHGLTWRMIGGMSGPLAGAIGEGASDTVAFLVNGDDVIGEYSASSAAGIRRFRYAGYPLTYGDVTGAEVHNDGEIYAAAMWRLRELWLASGRSNDSLFDHFVDGMNYTQPTPAFEHMRNGMLDSINASAGADAVGRCTLVWNAFAQFGIGAGASGVATGTTSVAITPSFAARSDCTH